MALRSALLLPLPAGSAGVRDLRLHPPPCGAVAMAVALQRLQAICRLKVAGRLRT